MTVCSLSAAIVYATIVRRAELRAATSAPSLRSAIAA
jgi:hypothetical protein